MNEPIPLIGTRNSAETEGDPCGVTFSHDLKRKYYLPLQRILYRLKNINMLHNELKYILK